MELKENTIKNLAILIDAENVLPAHADLIFDHAASLGNIARKEIFGAAQALGAWVSPVLKYAIHPNLTIKASKGKNSSDIALVIGAMDLLVSGGIDCVIIASSDSDFSALSVRLRNAGIEVIGMGMEKSNELWRTACSTFVVLQNQKPAATRQPARQSAQKPQ
ncbi:MAG: NYN domain-containing protein, partial [Clostridia bacterium]|nr:NYN domain-containing protein [Clostridia bacterium]